MENKRYKVMARTKRGDAWQEFTGCKVTTIKKMSAHVKDCLIGKVSELNYEFGIFFYEKRKVAKYTHLVGHWVLEKLFEVGGKSAMKIVAGDYHVKPKKKVAVAAITYVKKPETKALRQLKSIRRKIRAGKIKPWGGMSLVQQS